MSDSYLFIHNLFLKINKHVNFKKVIIKVATLNGTAKFKRSKVCFGLSYNKKKYLLSPCSVVELDGQYGKYLN